MTLIDIVKKNLIQNLRHYAIYFISLIVSVTIYYIFLTLRYDEQVQVAIGEKVNVESLFQVATVLLIIFVAFFVFYMNNFFLKKRKKEIGLYHLVGLEKRTIGWMLFVENIVLGIGSLIVGVLIGTLLSRLFTLLLFQLMKVDVIISLSFSSQALIQTIIVFVLLLFIVSLQGYFIMYRYTLLGLFKAEQAGEETKQIPLWLSVCLGLVAIGLIANGYYVSSNMLWGNFIINVIIVLGGVVFGTFLFFYFSIDFLLRVYRKFNERYYRYTNMLSVSSVLYRVKSNASMLTVISIFSAATIAMSGFSYSLYYSTKADTAALFPYDFTTTKEEAETFAEALTIEKIDFTTNVVDIVRVKGDLSDFEFLPPGFLADGDYISFVSENSIPKEWQWLKKNDAIVFDTFIDNVIFPTPEGKTIRIHGEDFIMVGAAYPENMINNDVAGYQVAVNEDFFQQLKEENKSKTYAFFNVDGNVDTAKKVYTQLEQQFLIFHDELADALVGRGIMIFISGFLSIVFLMGTGSMIYFKQISEVEQDKGRFRILHQLGFSTQEIMRTIRRVQLFIFGLPLLLGILHSIFALRSFAAVFGIDLLVPTLIATVVYVVIYALFYYLTIIYYHRVIRTIHLSK